MFWFSECVAVSGRCCYLAWILATIDERLPLASRVAMLLSVLKSAWDEWKQSLSTAKRR